MTFESTACCTRCHFEGASGVTSPSGADAVRFDDTGNDHDPTPPRSTLARLNQGPHGVLEDNGKGSAPKTLAELFNNVKYSDITIRLNETGVDLPAHRMVIGLQSPPLDEFIAEHPAGTSGVLRWDGASAHSIWRVFHYLYEGDYSEDAATALEAFEDEPGLLKHPRLFMLAGQLKMKGLKALALKRFKSQLQGDWRVEDLVDCIEEIYKYQKQNPDCLLLRPTVVEAALAYLIKGPVATVFIKGLAEIEDFRNDLMDLLAQ